VTALKGGRAGRKVSLALGGWNDSKGDKYSRLVNDPKARRYVPRIYHLKSDNLQYNMLACWVDGTNESSAKCLIFQALFFFQLRALKIVKL
jgi:hypothetical protein